MAITLFTMLAKLGLDAKDYTNGLDSASKHADRSSKSMIRSFSQIGKGVAVGVGAISAVAVATAGVAAYLMTKTIGPASDLQETISKVNVVFGEQADAILAYADDAATAMGMTRNEALSAAGTYGNLFRSMNITTGKSAEMSKGLVTLAADLASFNNMDPTAVLDKLRSGLSGETEPLKSLGININQVVLEQKALTMGLWNGVGPLNAAAKAQASYALILEQTSLAQGDFARTSAGLANQQRILKATVGDLKASMGTALLPAVQEVMSFLNMLAPLITNIVMPAMQSLGGAITDVAREWTHGIATLIANAANWGANIIESLAGGIAGSGAISGALRDVANEITMWLKPGSPPKLLPDLDKWGAGAIDAWLGGWTLDTQQTSALWNDLNRSLRPFLEEIDLGGGIDLGKVEAQFGANAPDVKAYLGSYQKVSTAVAEVESARAALAAAEESGDEDAIAAAKKKLEGTEKVENAARKTFYDQEARLAARIAAETRLTQAIENQGAAAEKVGNDSAARAAEAEQRAIDQAYLQYRLSVAGTPAGQMSIWEEELAKTTEGSAEYWQIMTRLVELQRAVDKEAAKVGGSLAAGMEEGFEAEAGQSFGDSGAHVQTGIGQVDWGGIGKAIGGSLIAGLVERLESIPTDMVNLSKKILGWSKLATTEATLKAAGWSASVFLIDGMIDLILSALGVGRVGDSLATQLTTVLTNLQLSFSTIGAAIGEGVLGGILSYFLSDAAAQAIAKSVITALVKALPYITPAGQAKLVWDFLTRGAESAGTAIGGWAGDNMPGIQDWLQQPAPEWVQPVLGAQGAGSSGDSGANGQSSVIVESGAVAIRVDGTNSATVREDARIGANIGVREALKLAGYGAI